MSEFRYNKLAKHWVLFAPNRAKRPSNFEAIKENEKDITNCPFEKGNESQTPNDVARIEDEKGWKCRVVPNLYHALSIDEDISSYKTGCFENKSGFGAHEVIIETPYHHKTMFEFTHEEFYDYFSIIKLRIDDLKKDIRLKYFSVFKNFGVNGGATLEHPHSQLIAMPFIPKTIENELIFYKKYKDDTQRDFFDDIIYEERNFAKGLLIENETFTAFCPYASRYPFEINIICLKGKNSILDLSDSDIYSLCDIMSFCFGKLYKSLGKCDFNLLIKNGAINSDENFNRFHIQIIPRLYRIAGFELDSNIMINTFLPETAAKILTK